MLHVYDVTRVTSHPCSEHVGYLARMCGFIGIVVQKGLILCAVFIEVELSCIPEVSGFFCDSLQRNEWKFISMYLVLREMMVSLVTPTAVELSYWMGDLCCGHPISLRAWHSVKLFLAMVKRPSSSALAADDMTFLMICAMVRTGSK